MLAFFVSIHIESHRHTLTVHGFIVYYVVIIFGDCESGVA